MVNFYLFILYPKKLRMFVISNRVVAKVVCMKYIYLYDSLFIRLNNDRNLPHQTGYALSDSEIEYSLIGVKNILSGALKTMKTSKKPETSILLKETISHIYYSNEMIAVKFIYPPNPTCTTLW